MPCIGPLLLALWLVPQALTGKVLVLPLRGGADAAPATLETLTTTVATEVGRYPDVDVVTRSELKELISADELKAIVGCGGETCATDIGRIAGARYLLTGTYGHLGDTWLLHLQLWDTGAGMRIGAIERRVAGGFGPKLLDALPSAVGELLAVKAIEGGPVAPLPLAGADKPLASMPTLASLPRWKVFTDGRGHFVAVDPSGAADPPLFAGDDKMLHAQRIIGSSREGDKAYGFVFWDPRFPSGWQRSVDYKDGRMTLQCGEKVTVLEPVDSARTSKIKATAHLFDVRWQRQGFAIARDDEGNYVFVDQAREGAGGDPFRLFVGRKGKVRQVPLEDAVVDDGGALFVTAKGRYVLQPSEQKASFKVGQVDQPLRLLDLFSEAAMIYTALGAYAGQPLGTPCDAAVSGAP